MFEKFQGSSIELPWFWETLVSRTAVRLIVEVSFSRDPHLKYERFRHRNLGWFLANDNQTPHSFRNGHICMKDAQSAETNEKLIFRFFGFFFFELWTKFLRYFEKWRETKFVPKDAQCSETDSYILATILRFLVFEIWSILYSRILVKWGRRRIHLFFYVRINFNDQAYSCPRD